MNGMNGLNGMNGPEGDLVEEVDIDERRYEMQQNARDCVVIIDGLPKAPAAKYDRLLAKLISVLSKLPGKLKTKTTETEDGQSITSSHVDLPKAEDGSALGYAFAQYYTPNDAIRAARSLHGKPLDRNYTFWAMTEYDIRKLQNTPEQYQEPKRIDVKSKEERVEFKTWLLDRRGRDQFMIRAGDETSIYWHDPVLKPELVS